MLYQRKKGEDDGWGKKRKLAIAGFDPYDPDYSDDEEYEDKLKATTVISKFASGVGTLFTEFTSGVNTLLTELVQGLTAPATSNSSKSRINRGTKIGESDDTSSEDSSESNNDTNENNMDIEHDKKKRMTREEHIISGNIESQLMEKEIDGAGETENMTNDPSQGAIFFGDARETESCENTLSGNPSAQFDIKSPLGGTSHLNLPSDSDMCSSDSNSPTDTMVSQGNSQQVDDKIRGSAAGLANRLCELKTTRLTEKEQCSGRTHEEIKHIVAKELGLLKDTCGQQFEEINDDKNSRKINARPPKQTPRR
ncbi:hypothetical protein ZWY2020_003694 [Hordeum vulgare]|nr:hypothetical protein ZWY2020_003694 [Hordeum vulgare]